MRGLQIGPRRSDQLTTRWLAERYDNSCIFGELPVYTARPTGPGQERERERCLIPRKDDGDEENSEKKANVKLPGTVEKIIPAAGDHIPEKAEIKIEGADDLYREVRIENKMIDAGGNTVKLKKGTEVEVTIEADKKDTSPKE
jgi:hypothetical protein